MTSGGATIVVANSIVSGNTRDGGQRTGHPQREHRHRQLQCDGRPGQRVHPDRRASSNLTGDPAALLLGPLTDNQGPTLTMAPAAGSPLIDAGSNALIPTGLTTDQRGFGFAAGIHHDRGHRRGRGPAARGPVRRHGPAPGHRPGGPARTRSRSLTTTRTGPTTASWPPTVQRRRRGRSPARTGSTSPLTFVGPAAQSDGTPLRPPTRSPPPAAAWDARDDGTLLGPGRAQPVHDLDGNFVPAGPCRDDRHASSPGRLTVTNADDSGPGSLRDAFTQAAAIGVGRHDRLRPDRSSAPREPSPLQSALASLPPDSGGA